MESLTSRPSLYTHGLRPQMPLVKILAALSFLPFIIVSLIRVAEIKHIITYAPRLRVHYSFARWTIVDSYMSAIWCGYCAFLIINLTKKLILPDMDVQIYSLGPVLLTIIATIALLIKHYRPIDYYKKHSAILKAILVAPATYIGYKTSAMTDQSIAEFTMTNASNFPNSQYIIKICATIAAWAYTAITFSLFIYLIISIGAIWKLQKLNNTLGGNKYKKTSLGARATITETENKEILVLFTIIVGITMMALAPLEYAKTIKANEINATIKTLIVETSFHLEPKICGVDAPKDSFMSLLPLNEAAIAIPDKELTYRFAVVKCGRVYDKSAKINDERTKIEQQ
jgi:hypothetical protein